MTLGIFNLRSGTGANITADINDENFVSHVNLALVHIVQHFLSALGPDFIIATMANNHQLCTTNITFIYDCYIIMKIRADRKGTATLCQLIHGSSETDNPRNRL